MTRATGIGSHPGADQAAFDAALRVVLDGLAGDGVPYLPEVPGRGAIATMTGRSLAVVAELGADLQPAGWRLTGGGSGVDHRRARSLRSRSRTPSASVRSRSARARRATCSGGNPAVSTSSRGSRSGRSIARIASAASTPSSPDATASATGPVIPPTRTSTPASREEIPATFATSRSGVRAPSRCASP